MHIYVQYRGCYQALFCSVRTAHHVRHSVTVPCGHQLGHMEFSASASYLGNVSRPKAETGTFVVSASWSSVKKTGNGNTVEYRSNIMEGSEASGISEYKRENFSKNGLK